MRKTIIFLSIATVILTSCSQPAAQNTNTDSTADQPAAKTETPAATTASAKDLCNILPMSEVSSLAGITFTKTKHALNNPQNTYMADCVYTNNDGYSVAIVASYDQPGMTAKQQYQQVLDYQKGQEKEFPSLKIDGVGEEAFMPQAGILSQINALNGNVWLSLSIYTGSKTGEKDHATAIAKRAFELL